MIEVRNEKRTEIEKVLFSALKIFFVKKQKNFKAFGLRAAACFRKFSPIDRDNPIFEVLFDQEVIFDISIDDETGEFEVMFHENAGGKYLSADLLIQIVEDGKRLIIKDGEK